MTIFECGFIQFSREHQILIRSRLSIDARHQNQKGRGSNYNCRTTQQIQTAFHLFASDYNTLTIRRRRKFHLHIIAITSRLQLAIGWSNGITQLDVQRDRRAPVAWRN